ncbi:MAG: ParB N-terminal domain-containing protein [Hyphomonadaceae bacterium]|nr:ParB N-terminal domain-containing protein [Hyphomonadaceae bacterium]
MRTKRNIDQTEDSVAQSHKVANDQLRAQIEYTSIGALTLARRNARRHPAEQIRQLMGAIEEFGIVTPLLVDADNQVIAGHGRLEALKRLGFTHVPVIPVTHLSAEQLRLYALADNKIAENAGWDEAVLRIEIAELRELDVDLSITGFETAEIDQLTIEPGFSLDAEPAAPIPRSAPVSRLGDIWELGPHRLSCADMLQHGALEAVVGSESVRASFTDPPFNVPVAGHVQVDSPHKHREFKMASGEMSAEQYQEFLTRAFQRTVDVSAEGSLHFVCQDWRSLGSMTAAGAAAFTEQKALIVWVKTNAGMGSLYRSQHELIFLYKKGKAAHTNNIKLGQHGRNRTNVWTYPGANAFGKGRDAALAAHPTVKPTALVADALLDVTRPGDVVLDPFAGSGTIILAAEKTGRRACAVEIEPHFVDVAVQRWQTMTGKSATLAGSQLNFSNVAAQRSEELAP